MTDGSDAIEWSPLTDRIGAVVRLDLTSPIGEETRRHLVDLFHRRQLLLFRDQDITLDQQVALVTCFSPLVNDPPVEYSPHSGTTVAGRFMTNVPGEQDALGGELPFHSEFAYLDPPVYGLSLWAESVPDENGPATLFLSCFDAYQSLPDELRRRIADLQVRHVRHGDPANPPDRRSEVPSGTVMSVAPLVYTHPLTGEATLYFSPLWTHSVVGMPYDEGDALLSELEQAVTERDSRYRHAWKLHDLLVWDNIKLMHAREAVEMGGRPRRLRRALIGDPLRYLAPVAAAT